MQRDLGNNKKGKEEKKWNRKRRRAKGGGWAEIRSVVEVHQFFLV